MDDLSSVDDLSFEWHNTEEEPVELTVALPSLNSEKIIWLALESLRRQTDIDFGWELLIWEEYGKSKEIVESFIGQLPNCQRVKFKALDPIKVGHQKGEYKGRILLLDKWVWMAREASITSKIYVLHATDCYSSPKRLHIHYHHFQNKDCYLSTQPKGLFYNILTEEKILYNGNWAYGKKAHLNMAYRTSFMRSIPESVELPRYIDSYLYDYFSNEFNLTRDNIFYDATTCPDNWKYSIDTDGYNCISLSRRQFYTKITLPFVKYDESYEDYIPKEVRDFLLNLKN